MEKVALSNSFVTAQALFDDTCAAIFVSTTFVGTCVLDGAENNATAVGRYASDFQNEVLLSDLSMPMTMSTVPSLRADSASDPTLTTSSFSPKLSASAAATSTSMPTILDEEEGCPARGWCRCSHRRAAYRPCRWSARTAWASSRGECSSAAMSSPSERRAGAAMHATAMQQDASVYNAS